MLPGLITLSVATITMSSALFTRRSRSGWLDELDGIRGDALTDPRGEVDGAMAAFEALANEEVAVEGSGLDERGGEPPSVVTDGPEPPEQTSPLAEMEAPLPPPPPDADRSTLPPPPRPTSGTADEPGPAEPAPAHPRVTPSPHPVRPHEMWHPEVLPTAPLASGPVSEHRGAEHAPSDSSPTSNEVNGHGEPDATPARFRFARLRAVLPGSGDGDLDGRSAPASDSEAHPSLLSELLSSYGEEHDGHGRGEDHVADDSAALDVADSSLGGFDLVDVAKVEGDGPGSFDAPGGSAARPVHLDHGEAPLVPTAPSVDGQALINGPVNRRTLRDEEFVRRRDLSAVLGDQRATATGKSASSTEVGVGGRVAVHGKDGAPGADSVFDAGGEVVEVASSESVQHDDGTARPGASEPIDDHVSADPAVPEVPTDGPPGTTAEPIEGGDATGPFLREALVVDPGGVIEVASGHLRFRAGDRYDVVGDEAAVEIALVAGSCWAALKNDAPKPAIVSIPAGELTIPPGSTALAVVEPDADVFVVIVAGEATLEHPAGRMRLRLGAMVLVSPGREPQVDVASVEEIAADPAVAANLALDAAR